MSGTEPDVRQRLSRIGEADEIEQRAGSWWVRRAELDVRGSARLMREYQVRLVTISARPDPDGGYLLVYHWDTGSALVNLSTTFPDGHPVPSITDLIPGADWAEREIRDYYGLEFSDRGETPTLMLLGGDPAGLFTRTGELGRDADPAATARRAADAGQPAEAGHPAGTQHPAVPDDAGQSEVAQAK